MFTVLNHSDAATANITVVCRKWSRCMRDYFASTMDANRGDLKHLTSLRRDGGESEENKRGGCCSINTWLLQPTNVLSIPHVHLVRTIGCLTELFHRLQTHRKSGDQGAEEKSKSFNFQILGNFEGLCHCAVETMVSFFGTRSMCSQEIPKVAAFGPSNFEIEHNSRKSHVWSFS